ncbi:MAG: dihydrolipoamide acetyltransferase family protein [Thermoproteota archaeon]|jgi:pyruvate dehydrogenase E2 component (dihydrolipoamide acetyltransferase)|nr:dihydrolipoamide acetyltransferase family protein [Thermoproteota archaeon]
MVTVVKLPKLGLTMEEATVLKWLKNVGEEVKEGETILLIETEKAVVEIQSPASGYLLNKIAKEGDNVKVGAPLAMIGEKSEIIEEHIVESQIKKEEKSEQRGIPVQPTESSIRIRATPKARRLALEKGVNLAEIKGTGPDGIITEEDVLRYISSRERFVVDFKEIIRKRMAKRMFESWQKIPHVHYVVEVNAEKLIEFKKKLEEKNDITYTDVIIKATAIALKEYPMFNSYLLDEDLKILSDINIGLAIGTDYGLVVPVIKNADKKDIFEISKNRNELIIKAKEKRLTLEDMSDATFTITNLGMYDVQEFMPIINFPQTAILGVGSIYYKLVMKENSIVNLPFLKLILGWDHRAFDGVTPAKFLNRIKEILENPEKII